MTNQNQNIVVIFVEGDTDFEFYQHLLQYYRANSKTKISKIKIYNLKGIGRFERKVITKIKYDILPKYDVEKISVFCCYDTDVFELGKKPPTNWKLIEKKLYELGITDFNEVKVVRMIEDWFLVDIDGLCKYLKIKKPRSLKGNGAYEKMKKLFKLGNKIYQKGNNSHKFLDKLDINAIRVKVKSQLKSLEDKINFKTKP